MLGAVAAAGLSGCAQPTGPAQGGASDRDAPHSEHLAMLSNPASRGVVSVAVLDAYLNRILDRVTASADPARLSRLKLRVYLSGTDDVGADTFSDGAIYVRWRSLGALESEDELAALLAHEASHLLLGHLQDSVFSSLAKPLGALTTLAATATPAALLTSVVGGQYLDKAGLAAWSRAAELEADAAGLALLRKAGYDGNAYFELFDAQDRPAVEPPRLSDNLRPTGKPGEYTLDLGHLRFGDAERSHPDYTVRRAAIRKLLSQSDSAPTTRADPIDSFARIKGLPEVAGAIAGLEAASRAWQAFDERNEPEVQRQLDIALRSPVARSAKVQLTLLNYTQRKLPNAALVAHLEPLASSPQAPIFVGMMQLTFAVGVRDWPAATRVADRLQARYLPRPDLYPLIAKAYAHRAQQLAATLPKMGSLPMSGPGREADFAEYSRLTKAGLSLTLQCVATGDLNIMAGCSQAAN